MEFERDPFLHAVIDDFFPLDVAAALEGEFPAYGDSDWVCYDNPVERKKAISNWHRFPALTYTALHGLLSIERINGVRVSGDYGLHGGGWHMHKKGGYLNPHEDYSIHPKLGMQRRFNLIVYLSSDYKEEYGGHLGFWKDGEIVKTIWPKFNRAVIFNTDGNVHGLASSVSCPEGIYRKSLAVYYLSEPQDEVGINKRARFYPTKEQGEDVEKFCLERAGL